MTLTLYNLEAEILESLRRINRAIELRSRALLLNYGLTAPQLAVLQVLDRLQPITSARLSTEIHLSRPTVTGILNRLELRGLIERTRGGEDRRSVDIRLTDQGRRMLDGAPSMLRNEFQLRLEKLKDWERTQILASIQRLAEMLAPGPFEDLNLGDDLPEATLEFGGSAPSAKQVEGETSASGDEPKAAVAESRTNKAQGEPPDDG